MAFALMLFLSIGAMPVFAQAPSQSRLPLSSAEADSAATALVSTYYERLLSGIDLSSAAADSAFISGFRSTLASFAAMNPDGQFLNGAQVALSLLSASSMMTDMNVPIPHQALASAFVVAVNNGKPEMTPEQATAYMRRLVMHRNGADGPEIADSVAERRFIEEAAATPGAVILPSGTVLITISDGVGPTLSEGEPIEFTYVGRLSDRSVFDDSTDEPLSAHVGDLVPGFNEALLSMRHGGVYRIVIPAPAAYGPDGIPGVIPGGAAIDFNVSLK